jgi:hypothetical protein
MPIYIFYPNKSDGVSVTFEAHELAGDDIAINRAADILAQYESSHSVAIWEGERQVALRERETA